MEANIISDEWGARVARLSELIARKSEAIRIHESQPNPDRLAIEQYKELRACYLEELAQLMNQYGVVLRFEQTISTAA
jgi:hypothetical protein